MANLARVNVFMRMVRYGCATGVCLLPGLLLITKAPAQDFIYTTNNGTITITGYANYYTFVNVDIPSTIDGLPVTRIGPGAFGNHTNLTTVTIPDSVVDIGDGAFTGSFVLSSLSLGRSVTNIGQDAFYACRWMTNVVIPDSVVTIGADAFSVNEALTNVWIGKGLISLGTNAFEGPYFTVSALNTAFTSLDGSLFDKDQTLLIRCPANKTGNYIIPDSVVVMGDSAFVNCYGLSKVTIGAGVTNIPDNEFSYCVGLTNVVLGPSVTDIGNAAFSYCYGLQSLKIPDNVTHLGTNAFLECQGITNLTLGTGLTYITDGAFSWLWRLPSVTLPDVVTDIRSGAFSFCGNLVSVHFGTNFIRLGDDAFQGCGLTNLVIPDNVISLGDGVFSRCSLMTNIWIGTGLTNLPDGEFADSELMSISVSPLHPVYSSVDGLLFDKSKTTLIAYPPGKGAFYVIGSGVTRIGPRAFQSCGLYRITIPDTVTNIGAYAFFGCFNLDQPVIPNGVSEIGEGTFAACSNLKTITIGSGVTSLAGDAFDGSAGLSGLRFLGNAPALSPPSWVFVGLSQARVYYLPGTTGWGATFGGLPTTHWMMPRPVILSSGASFGLGTSGFGFTISWASNAVVLVEASTNLANANWVPVSTQQLMNGSSYFSDPEWENYSERFYRVRSL